MLTLVPVSIRVMEKVTHIEVLLHEIIKENSLRY